MSGIISVDLQRDLVLDEEEIAKGADAEEYKLFLDDDADGILDDIKEQHGISRSVSVRVAVKIFNEIVKRQHDLIPQLKDVPNGNEDIRRVL